MDNQNQIVENSIPPKPPTNFLLIGLIAIVAGVIGSGATYLALQSKTQTEPQPTPIVQATPTPTPDPTANWEIYTNTKYGYSLKHPPKFTVQSMFPPDQNPLISANVLIQATQSFKSLTISAAMTKNESENLSDFIGKEIEKLKESNKQNTNYIPLKIINESVIDGRQAIFVSNNDNSKDLDLRVYVQKDKTNVIYVQLGPIFSGTEEEYKTFFYQILSTLKFTNP